MRMNMLEVPKSLQETCLFDQSSLSDCSDTEGAIDSDFDEEYQTNVPTDLEADKLIVHENTSGQLSNIEVELKSDDEKDVPNTNKLMYSEDKFSVCQEFYDEKMEKERNAHAFTIV